ncbi:hypothetical protein V2I60_05095 [Pseudomonas viridiflava]|uniref:OB-fold protein n=1 Tax=Pseudomonas viridiflava TaxID=33069 RepID=UPI002EAF0C01|nr:hypothetical protein [Pseudomonas viridiflava]
MNEMKVPSSPRKVGIILGILIALMPQFFAWLLLRKGHTKKARLIGFGWMALWMIISLVLHKPANRDSSASVAPAVAVAPAASPATPAEVAPVLATAPAPAPAPAAKPVAQATAEPVAEPVKAYTALQVSTGYDENTVAADMLYKDKRVQVTGRILDINTDFMGVSVPDIGWTQQDAGAAVQVRQVSLVIDCGAEEGGRGFCCLYGDWRLGQDADVQGLCVSKVNTSHRVKRERPHHHSPHKTCIKRKSPS